MKMRTIELDHGGTKYPVKAYVFGEWAAHKIPFGIDPGWRVSHVATGFSTSQLADGLTRRDAIAIARALSERVPKTAWEPYKVKPSDTRTTAAWTLALEDRCIVMATFGEVLGG